MTVPFTTIYIDEAGNEILRQMSQPSERFIPAVGDGAMLVAYGRVTVIGRVYDWQKNAVFLTCDRYDDGDSDDAQ